MQIRSLNRMRAAVFSAVLMATPLLYAQKNVITPGDAIIASSANSPGSEGVANAIDGKTTKYLNFDSGRDGKDANKFSPSGFVVTPSVGVTRVTGVAMQSANDGPERDPKSVTIEGSNDDTVTAFNAGNWEMIATVDNIPTWASVFPAGDRFKTQTFSFPNLKAYKHYRWTVTATQGTGTGNTCCMQIAEVALLGRVLPADVTQPGDPIIASSANSPGSEGVANAIDGKTTKYLNFDSGRDGKDANKFSPSGFVVSPSLGVSLVTGITLQSANDGPERDPKGITLEGSNDDSVTSFAAGNWELIYKKDDIQAWADVFGTANRFKTQTFLFDNFKPFKHYRWTVTATQGTGTGNTCCMQIAEVELLGTGAPQDVTQPGDAIIASSANSPGSEGVANAIDGKTTKYLNFDSGRDGKDANKFSPSGFVVTPSIGASTIIGIALQSANDGPERDPKSFTVEGSNDDAITTFSGGNWELIANVTNITPWTDLFGTTNRFQTQSFYFPNTKSYKSYRWLVTATQGTGTGNTCCMQIAEVQFLAESANADCTKARFVSQPTDTPALAGSTATFYATLNGPWPIQWLKNGQVIPGATQTSYTTEPVTAENQTNIYNAQIVGCEVSSPVQAKVFKPSSTKSIAINFVGGGANGAPTSIAATDIAGLHPQAYWNNLTAASGASGDIVDADGNPVGVIDSDNSASSITFDWTTGGNWGSGTGAEGPATTRMLNGVTYASVGTPATVTFGGVPAGTHSVLVYCVNIPLQFQNVNFSVAGASTQTYYVRTMNADEYNPAPGFYRGSSTDANNRTIASYVRFDNVSPKSDGTIVVSWDTISGNGDRGAGVNGMQLLLNSAAPGASPQITAHPQPTVVVAGKTAVLSVKATGDNLTYQWRKNGKNLPNGGNITGATTDTLTISSFAAGDAGIYSVGVFNAAGSSLSKNAVVSTSTFTISEAISAYLPLDEKSGNTAANAGGTAGNVVGTATWSSGKIANGFSFDGSTYIKVDSYTKATTALSGSAWVNVAAGAASTETIMRNGQGGLAVGGDNSGQFELNLNLDANDNTLHPSVSIAAGPNIVSATSAAALSAGAWHHIAFSADGAQLRLYVDGKEAASTDYSGTINTPNVAYLSIGARLALDADSGVVGADLNAPNALVGQLDDLGLWNRAITATEVGLVYAAGQAGKPGSSVVETPPTNNPGKLTVSVAAGQITVSWDNGTLQTATALGGTWTDSTSTSPLKESVGAGNKFYRTVVK